MTRLKRLFLSLSPEWIVATVLFFITIAFAHIIHAPLQLPAPSAFLFIGYTYLLPFILISLWVLLPLPFLIYRGELKKVCLQIIGQLSAALCLGLVMWLHFHIKLWIPLINPASYDSVYEAVDRACFFWLDPLISWRGQWQSEWINNLYFNLFMFMFLTSFIVHYVRSQKEFHRVLLAAILVQAFGALAYLIAPAVGPFIYHPGVNAHVTLAQHNLLKIHENLIAGGAAWLPDHTGEVLAAGLAAMPSLHIAASAVFLYYAQKYCRWLACLYWPCFLWFVFEAMASRWHYGIDLVFGFALACGCVYLANAWRDAHETAAARESLPAEEPASLTVPLAPKNLEE